MIFVYIVSIDTETTTQTKGNKMNGSDKQIEYAETLRNNLLNRLDVKQFELLPLDFFSDDKSNELRKEHFEALKNFDGYAGYLIDAIKMSTWGLGDRQQGYHDFMIKICGYRRENKQWVK